MLGPRGRRWLNKQLGNDRVFLDFDPNARQHYEQRAQAAHGVVEGPDAAVSRFTAFRCEGAVRTWIVPDRYASITSMCSKNPSGVELVDHRGAARTSTVDDLAQSFVRGSSATSSPASSSSPSSGTSAVDGVEVPSRAEFDVGALFVKVPSHAR